MGSPEDIVDDRTESPVIDTPTPVVPSDTPEVTLHVTPVRREPQRLHPSRRAPKILFVSSEVHPFSRTGGLADVAGSLPKALADSGCDVAIATPLYHRTFPESYSVVPLARFGASEKPLDRPWSLSRSFLDGRIPVYLVGQEDYFGRDQIYGEPGGDYPDNPERFACFSRGVLAAIKAVGWKPDVVHCNDWQTGLLPLYLQALAGKDRFYSGIRSLFTVHNLAFPGMCPAEKLGELGLGPDYLTMDRLEFHGRVSLLKAGLVYADRLSTVSPGYCREIQTSEFGCGLDGLLRRRSSALAGIMNGVDSEVWNPGSDRALAANFSAHNLAGKPANKRALQRAEKLPVRSSALVSMVSRLTDQKGFDLVVSGIDRLMALPLQLVVMGEGESRYVSELKRFEAAFPDRFRVHPHFELDQAKRIYAASDIYLMPSRFEPCGLSELIGMRYGAVPVVRRTGGLSDAVREFDPATGEGNGFQFDEYSVEAMTRTLERALAAFRRPELWARVRENGMREDFSWRRSVRSYRSVYDALRTAA